MNEKENQNSEAAALKHRHFRRLRRFLTLARTKRLKGRNGKLKTVSLGSCNHILLFPFVYVYSELLLRALTGTGVFQHIVYPVVFGLALGCFLSAVTCVFPPKANRMISLIALAGTSTLFTVECLVRKSFQRYMTIGSLMSGATGVMTQFGSDFFRAVYTGIPVIIVFFLPFFLYLIFGKKHMHAWQYRLPFAAMLLAACFGFFGIGVLAANIGSVKARYTTQYEFNSSTQIFGLITGIRLSNKYSGSQTSDFVIQTDTNETAEKETESAADKIGETVEEETIKTGVIDGVYRKDSVDFSLYGDNIMDLNLQERIENGTDSNIVDIDTYVNSLTATSKNAFTGLFEGKNLILICAESYSDAFVSEELTPTLYRLIHNGFYFSEYYQPEWGGSTTTGEFSFLIGIAPLDEVDTMMDVKDHNLYFTMGNQLQRLGYYSAAYHNGSYTYYNRNLTHQNLGYSTFMAGGNGLEDLAGSWYPSDAATFSLTMDIYLSEQPFSVFYMTADGHCTYTADDPLVAEYLDEVVEATGGIYKDTTNYYICYQMGLEKALTIMVEKLEEAGIADDTVICLTSDHYPYGLAKSSTFGNTEDYLKDLLGDDYQTADWLRDHSSLIIWSGCLENEYADMACEIAEPTYSLDILPTLSNLFGLEYDSRLLVGRDAFSEADALVLWENHTWITEYGRYNAKDGTFTANDGVTVDDDYVEQISAIVKNKLTYSRAVVNVDYYGDLFGEDDVT